MFQKCQKKIEYIHFFIKIKLFISKEIVNANYDFTLFI